MTGREVGGIAALLGLLFAASFVLPENIMAGTVALIIVSILLVRWPDVQQLGRDITKILEGLVNA